jgi:hypothetical protein
MFPPGAGEFNAKSGVESRTVAEAATIINPMPAEVV